LTASTTVGVILCSIRDFPSLASIWLLGKYPLFIFVFNKGFSQFGKYWLLGKYPLFIFVSNKGFSQFGKYWVIRQVSVIFMSNSIRGGG
jgi:hypothetical protein